MTATEQVGQSKTKAEIGEGDKVIRRTESGNRKRPLVGEVERVLANGKLRVRWDGFYHRPRWCRQTLHTTVSAGSLLPATEENIVAAQHRMDVRREKALSREIEHFEEYADRFGEPDDSLRGHRGIAARLREEQAQLREKLGMTTTSAPR